MKQPTLSLQELHNAALKEDWDTVDASLTQNGNEEYETWALSRGMENADPNLRDLAVSILERSPRRLDAKTAEKLAQLMGNDENIYVRYRSAFALFSHGAREPEVINILQMALDDEDVVEIAKTYLRKLKVR